MLGGPFAGNAHWAEPSPLFAHRAHPTPLKCKNEYPVLPLGEETALQAVVGSIVWASRRLEKSRCRKMSARGYALHSVWPQLSFSLIHQYVASALNELTHLMFRLTKNDFDVISTMDTYEKFSFRACSNLLTRLSTVYEH